MILRIPFAFFLIHMSFFWRAHYLQKQNGKVACRFSSFTLCSVNMIRPSVVSRFIIDSEQRFWAGRIFFSLLPKTFSGISPIARPRVLPLRPWWSVFKFLELIQFYGITLVIKKNSVIPSSEKFLFCEMLQKACVGLIFLRSFLILCFG